MDPPKSNNQGVCSLRGCCFEVSIHSRRMFASYRKDGDSLSDLKRVCRKIALLCYLCRSSEAAEQNIL